MSSVVMSTTTAVKISETLKLMIIFKQMFKIYNADILLFLIPTETEGTRRNSKSHNAMFKP